MAKKDKKTMDLPEVSDIPGQEHVRPPRLGELGDTTASSADEEGDDVDGLNGDDDDLELSPGSNVSREERRTLASVDNREVDTEDEVLNEAALDSTDDDGDPLNEESFGHEVSGDDLDVPEGDDDPIDEEEIGEGDEENSEYSTDKNEDDSDINYDA
jgi:hypothetical protein